MAIGMEMDIDYSIFFQGIKEKKTFFLLIKIVYLIIFFGTSKAAVFMFYVQHIFFAVHHLIMPRQRAIILTT